MSRPKIGGNGSTVFSSKFLAPRTDWDGERAPLKPYGDNSGAPEPLHYQPVSSYLAHKGPIVVSRSSKLGHRSGLLPFTEPIVRCNSPQTRSPHSSDKNNNSPPTRPLELVQYSALQSPQSKTALCSNLFSSLPNPSLKYPRGNGILPTAVVQIFHPKLGTQYARVLLDSGSEVNVIFSRFANQIGLPRIASSTTLTGLGHGSHKSKTASIKLHRSPLSPN